MVGGTIALVVIAYLTLKKMGGGSSGGASSGGVGSAGSGGATESAGSAAGNQSQLDSLTSQIGILNNKVTDLTSLIPIRGPEHGTGLLPGPAITPGEDHKTALPPDHNGHGTGLLPAPPLVHTVTPKSPTTPKPRVAVPGGNDIVHKPSTGSYTVKKGDTLSSIGRRFGESWQTLYKANKKVVGSNPNLILPGQKLVVNATAPHPATPAKPATPSSGTWKQVPMKPAHPPTHGTM